MGGWRIEGGMVWHSWWDGGGLKNRGGCVWHGGSDEAVDNIDYADNVHDVGYAEAVVE